MVYLVAFVRPRALVTAHKVTPRKPLPLGWGGIGALVTLRDGLDTSGPKIATVDIAKIAGPIYLEYNCDFNDGLHIVSAGSSVDVTLVFE